MAGSGNQHKLLAAEAERVAKIGGPFSIRHFYTDNWYEEFKITYPEGECNAI